MKKLTTKSFLALFGLIMFANFATAQTVLFQDDFESGNLSKWTIVDNDGDGKKWLESDGSGVTAPHSGSYMAISWSYFGGGLNPDNWMISPDVTGATSIQYYVSSNEYSPDHYAIMASKTGTNIGDFTVVFEETVPGYKKEAKNEKAKNTLKNMRAIPWAVRNIALPAGTKYVAFRHYNSQNKNYLIIDDVVITSSGGTTPDVNMDRYIELTVQQGKYISFDLWANEENTGVKIESGTSDTTFVVGVDGTDFKTYYAGASTMRVYGNVSGFDCYGNYSYLTGLDVSNNKELEFLACAKNEISSLDASGLAVLETLFCYNNKISSIKTTGCTNLMYFECDDNNITSLDVSGHANLIELYCYDNKISTIKIDGCESLYYIDCSGNQLSACGLDSILYQLPARTENDEGEIYIKDGAKTNPGALTCCDTLGTNRFWRVLDWNDGYGSTSIVNTTYACPDFLIIEEMSASSFEINIYPNPASNNLNIECGEKINNLELYDALGRMLISKGNILNNTSIDVSNLDSGIYILKIRTVKGSGEYKVVKK